MDFEAHQTGFGVQLDKPLDGHATFMVEDLVAGFEVPESGDYLASIFDGFQVILSIDCLTQKCGRLASYQARLP